MNKKELIAEIEMIRDILNKGVKSQLMRGDRDSQQTFHSTLNGIEKANGACLDLINKIKDADLLYNVD